MPLDASKELKKTREESLDEHEKDENHLKMAEEAYLELSERYGFINIECAQNSVPKKIEEIHEEVYEKVLNFISKKSISK